MLYVDASDFSFSKETLSKFIFVEYANSSGVATYEYHKNE